MDFLNAYALLYPLQENRALHARSDGPAACLPVAVEHPVEGLVQTLSRRWRHNNEVVWGVGVQNLGSSLRLYRSLNHLVQAGS